MKTHRKSRYHYLWICILVCSLALFISCSSGSGGGGGKDEGQKSTWYLDSDNDGYGNPNITIQGESQPEGYVSDHSDIDDSEATIHPGAPEIGGDGIDNDQDGQIDEATSQIDGNTPWVGNWIQINFLGDDEEGWDEDDYDGIGFSAAVTGNQWVESDRSGCSVTYTLTVDSDMKFTKKCTNVGAACGNYSSSSYHLFDESGRFEFSSDNNILITYFDLESGDEIVAFKWAKVGSTDNELYEKTTWYKDSDGDGYGDPSYTLEAVDQPEGYVLNNSDTDDSVVIISTGSPELCGDGIDNDQNGMTDESCESLVAYFPFDGNAKDASGNNLNGIEHNGVEYTYGVKGQCIRLDGIDDYISINHNALLNLGSNFTLSVWINLEDVSQGNGARIIDKATAGSCNGWVFDTYDRGSSGRRMRMDVSCPWVNSDTIFSLNNWRHLAVSVSNLHATFYLDGMEDGNGIIMQPPINSLDLFIGGPHITAGSVYYFDGMIDEVRIYNKALSVSEIQNLSF